ncbi:hypothetical protein F2Q68_00007247 [Brassica cretica]|uniref:Regulator of chromosome condensation 1/beta-lactamase-inhibitor protein II n=1 Tax=Brassica cretica TaxID=69181 RepID=A0A8S9KM22_BRACR|nr:hypothetical protein F2Q68_00007247 [Brassica cretica]
MEDKTTPLPISEELSRKITSLAAGEAHTIALTGDGCVYSWGRGMFGRIGTGRETDELVPARVEFESPDRSAARIVGIAAGAYHSLVVSDREATSDFKVCAVKAGSMMSLAIDNAGGLWMWGNVPPQDSGPEPRLCQLPVRGLRERRRKPLVSYRGLVFVPMGGAKFDVRGSVIWDGGSLDGFSPTRPWVSPS